MPANRSSRVVIIGTCELTYFSCGNWFLPAFEQSMKNFELIECLPYRVINNVVECLRSSVEGRHRWQEDGAVTGGFGHQLDVPKMKGRLSH